MCPQALEDADGFGRERFRLRGAALGSEPPRRAQSTLRPTSVGRRSSETSLQLCHLSTLEGNGPSGFKVKGMPESDATDQTSSIEVVRSGYELAAARYAAARDPFENEPHLERFIEVLPPPARVLDVGCGSGVPVDRYLVDHGYDVTGIDIAPKQIELARAQVPEASFEVRNMLDLQAGELNVDGLVSFYAVFHTPRDSHSELLRRFASFVRPDGALLITMGAEGWEGKESDWHGVEMYWSHFDADTNRQLVYEAGLDIESAEIDERSGEAHQVILAVRRSA